MQVREFPDELYDELKEYAASQHRSMAQQVIVAVEQMLACDEERRRASRARARRARCVMRRRRLRQRWTPKPSEPPAPNAARSCSGRRKKSALIFPRICPVPLRCCGRCATSVTLRSRPSLR